MISIVFHAIGLKTDSCVYWLGLGIVGDDIISLPRSDSEDYHQEWSEDRGWGFTPYLGLRHVGALRHDYQDKPTWLGGSE